MKFSNIIFAITAILFSLNCFANQKTLIIEVQKGDTLSKIMNEVGISNQESFKAVESLSQMYDPASLKLGEKIKLDVSQDLSSDQIELSVLTIELPSYEEVSVTKDFDGSFVSSKTAIERDVVLLNASGVIKSSLFNAAKDAKIPTQILFDLIKIYSYDIDFQRDIRKGDNFDVLYEQYYDKYGNKAGTGDLAFASMNVRGENYRVYLFETSDGFTQYFDQNGKSVKKSLLKTPVDGARITSGFGNRRHPILGYNKMHKGIDFGAPTGTPIYAAGNGYINYLGRKGSYGKYIKIRHANSYSTAYAHLNGYKKGLQKGSKVKQGQVIGYVGSTGRSTGPHLHYEILRNNRQINPLSLKATPEKKLKGVELGIFTQFKRQIDLAMHQSQITIKKAATNKEPK